ncbi:MAG: response regulator [Caldilineaceae bacterium]
MNNEPLQDRRAQLRFRKLIEKLPSSLVFVLDPGLQVTYAGGAMISSSTFRPAAYIGRAVQDIAPTPIYATIAPYLHATLQGQETSFELTTSAGAVFQAHTTPIADDDGSVQEILVLALEITDKKRAEEALRADIAERKLRELEREQLVRQLEDRAEQLAQVMESAPAGVLLLDNLNRVLLANKRAADKLALMATYDADECLVQLGGVDLEMLLGAPPAGQWHTLQVGRQTYAVIAHPVESGSLPSGWAMVVRDVTAEREVHEQLQRQERLAAVGQLAAGIAHDFNNIMSVISIYAELACEAEGLAEHERARMRTIVDQAHRATRMIRQILDFSRQSVFERQLLDLLPLLKEQVKLLRETLPENIEIALVAAPGEYLVPADATRMQQLIMNLAVNARDAMPDGGKLHLELLRTTVDPTASLPVPGMAAGEWLQLVVGDSGHGIAADHLPRIFEPFFTTKEPGKGTGLGLAQVHGIVAQHDGHITVASEPAAGTIFTLYLPAVAAPVPEEAAPIHHAAPLGTGECVLLVEDDAAVRSSLAALLEQWNYRVVEAANGQEALACLARPWRHVDVIVSDVVMPRLGGIGLVKALRKDGVETPVILMSGHTAAAERLNLPATGVQGWVDKPPGTWQLAKALAKALGKL